MSAIRSPGTVDLVREPLGMLELPRLGLSLLNGLSRRRGRGEPAMVLPGWATDDRGAPPTRAFSDGSASTPAAGGWAGTTATSRR